MLSGFGLVFGDGALHAVPPPAPVRQTQQTLGDLVRLGLHRLGVGGRVEVGLGGDAGYTALSLALVYRM